MSNYMTCEADNVLLLQLPHRVPAVCRVPRTLIHMGFPQY